jgi:hypothetical protein
MMVRHFLDTCDNSVGMLTENGKFVGGDDHEMVRCKIMMTSSSGRLEIEEGRGDTVTVSPGILSESSAIADADTQRMQSA